MIARRRMRAWIPMASLAAALMVALVALAARVQAQDTPTVAIADAGSIGLILTDSAGLTLYTFDRDTPGVSNCSGPCVMTWPLLLLPEGDPIAPSDLPGTLGVIIRTDGSRQVTYNDKPLYLYARDQNPGDTAGDGVGGVWHVAKP